MRYEAFGLLQFKNYICEIIQSQKSQKCEKNVLLDCLINTKVNIDVHLQLNQVWLTQVRTVSLYISPQRCRSTKTFYQKEVYVQACTL